MKRTILALSALTLPCLAEFDFSQAPKPMNQTQLDTWRAQKSATAKKSREKSTAFFTGKPYIESLGSYSFLFRNYNPELCRWTTPDPSGFPDGANPNIYVNNGATSSFDYEGLWKLKLRGTVNEYTNERSTTYGTTTSRSFYSVNASPNGTVSAVTRGNSESSIWEPYDTGLVTSSVQFSVDENGNIRLDGANLKNSNSDTNVLASTAIKYTGVGTKTVTIESYAGVIFSGNGTKSVQIGPEWARATLQNINNQNVITESGSIIFIYDVIE